MKRYATASFTGLNSTEIYSLHYPDSLLKFCAFDFSGFVRRTTDFCKKCEANGEFYIDEAIALRNSISACHKFYEANIHSLFEKIIQDFFIEYVCREKGIGPSALWNNYIQAKNNFEKTLFSRLTEYRHGKAVNQWVNLLKIQDYAKKKTEFIFSEKADLVTAGARRDYFDLTFIIAANEMGYPTDGFGTARMYSVGRLPSAPFVLSMVSKEIMKTALSELQYPEEEPEAFSPLQSDSEAMDVFSHIKNIIPEKPDTVIGTIVNTMRSMPKKVYVAESFKSVIDLEIDLMLESGMVIYRCERCGEYFVRNKEYDEDYCDNEQPNGRTCYEISNMVPMRTVEEIEELDAMTNELYSYMSKRINVDLTQRDFSEWYQYFMAIKENIAHRRLSIDEYRDFEKYSKELKFTPSAPKQAAEKPAPAPTPAPAPVTEDPRVKPFVFERIDRSELYEQEYRRRKREAQEEEELEALATANITQEPTPTVKVMKADETRTADVSLFENPFDGAFDEGISELSRVNERGFKPLDDIFSFEAPQTTKQEAVSEAPQKQTTQEEISAQTPEPDGFVMDTYEEIKTTEEPAGGFEREIAKASYIRESGTTRKRYAANMYTRTANSDEVTFPEIVSDGGERMTEDDFDILPSATPIKPREEAPKKAEAQPEPEIIEIPDKPKRKRTPPRITLGENGGTNKTQRVLDGLFSPVKAKNPFLTDDNEDEE